MGTAFDKPMDSKLVMYSRSPKPSPTTPLRTVAVTVKRDKLDSDEAPFASKRIASKNRAFVRHLKALATAGVALNKAFL
jgi:hypothetical protein